MNDQQVKEYNEMISNRIESNQLIADFMGENWFQINGLDPKGDLKFGHDWNWLMPVVEKIEGINQGMYSVEMKRGKSDTEKKYICEIVANTKFPDYYEIVKFESNNSKLEACFVNIACFIKIYNKK